ncbi:MAG: glycosyltransferase family 39 protein [Thermoguttaceae bacterium]
MPDSSSSAPCSPRFRVALLAVLALSFVVRGGALLATRDAFRLDTDGYRQLASNLVRHGTFSNDVPSPRPLRDGQGERVPTAYRPPLYPLLLAGCMATGLPEHLMVGLLHLGLGLGTVALAWRLGRSWTGDRRVAALAALLVTCDPILLRWSTQLMTETLATFLTTAGLWALTWAGRADGRAVGMRAALAGVVLGLAALCRPSLLLWAVAAGVALAAANRRRLTAIGAAEGPCHRHLFAVGYGLAPFALGAAIVISPWAIRNQWQFGRPVVTTTHGGYTLLLANNPEFYEWLRSAPWGSVWRADRFNAAWDARKPADELQADRLAYAEAWQTIRAEPGTFVRACFVRLGRFWSPLPHQVAENESSVGRLSRWTVAAWYGVELTLAILFLARLACRAWAPTPSTWLWGGLLVASLMAAHVLYWTDMRMRAPAMPVIALAAASVVFWRRPLATQAVQQSV